VPTPQVIDACVLINLLATEELKSILDSIGRPSLICSIVQLESIYLRTGDPNNPKELINLAPFIEQGTLSVCEIEDQKEEVLYVDFASVLDDGEAMSLAIAINRTFHLVTDERKARRLFSDRITDPKLLISTSDLVRHWARDEAISANKLHKTLRKIESRASYRPPVSDRNYKWWMKALQ
jgi:predicted nucleic acid-binding protein